VLVRAEIADHAFAGVDADADPYRKKDLISRFRLPEAVEIDELAARRLRRICDIGRDRRAAHSRMP